MFAQQSEIKKIEFLEHAKQAREGRASEKKRDDSSVVIQACVRGFLTRRRLHNDVRQLFDSTMYACNNTDKKLMLEPAMDIYRLIKKFLFVYDEKRDIERLELLCRYLVVSMESDNAKDCYVSVALNKEHVLCWIRQLKCLLWLCCQQLNTLKPDNPNSAKSINLYLHVLVTFTSTSNWKLLRTKSMEPLRPSMNQLCNNVMGYLHQQGMYSVLQELLSKGLARCKPCLKHATLSAIITLALRPLVAASLSDNLISLFVLHILSVPAVVQHLSTTAPECLAVFMSNGLFKKSLELLISEQSTRIVFNSLEGNYALCLLGNIIQLADIEKEQLPTVLVEFTVVVSRLLERCQKYVVNKRSNLTHWHPVLGWFSQKTDIRLHEALPHVVKQLSLLWSHNILRILFAELLAIESPPHTPTSPLLPITEEQHSNKTRDIFRKAFTVKQNGPKARKQEQNESVIVTLVCTLYQTALSTLTQLRLNILTGISHHESLLPKLWYYIHTHVRLKTLLEQLSGNSSSSLPDCQVVILFCDCTSHLITILDDVEMYDQQRPFTLQNLVDMGAFFNQLIFRLVWNNIIDVKVVAVHSLFIAAHTLTSLLYERDCRRPYAPKNHWLIKDTKPGTLLAELEKGKKTASLLLQKTPFIIPHKERVMLFRKAVGAERTAMGLTESVFTSPQSTLISIHRSRIIEDGYRQLAAIPAQALKGVIRVKFVNEQMTSEMRLYPSPTSSIHDNHLHLFEFVGRMLGKAVYEGIVVEVPFAPFFLSHVLGHHHSSRYSSIDELPSLDPELYKNLTYVKHYDGDVTDLELTFSCDEDVMGKVVNHELVPGGKAIAVTKENIISYVHMMAHFRMYTQIKDQTNAFIRGFRSIINPDWLALFSRAPELQCLISGDTMAIDLHDLRAHTQYYGGFHNNHRVIVWLWDVLDHDFTAEERGQFLKFVTSCSKAPLLGFSNLEPPFSIRCVEVSDDQDTGDTVGSVLRGLFSIRKKDPVGRLPTSSTCFNLLKLPNYQRKSTLRDKLRYAITSNTGFELS
ncbi:PREDICTED: ubiquitin-protein ligase E3B-like isoform X2 [Priapulus caudatus]|uniref:HECT-type E3 ubiquitin transferase n=1 Tax=Priapulus caudatus TaxID=37621 RepID=A0ABM1EGF4_PRICU|nr:PREDICTED: ubiquitin-protein ligase E3B-like isoform X2 [Priapulus caudatus]